MGLIEWLKGPPRPSERADPLLSLDEWAGLLQSFQFNGVSYTLGGTKQEDLGSSFPSMAAGAMKGNGVVFACMLNRMLLFAEARFMFRNMRRGKPGDLFDYAGSDLGLLREPWEGGTTGDLLARMLQYVDLAGNAYVVRRAGRLTPLRPDWTSIIGGVPGDTDSSVWHPDARVLGYMYTEGGPGGGNDPVFYLADEVAHFAPIPDPQARFRGMSWLTPIVREVMADKAMNDHKIAFLENGATPNLAVKLDVDDLEKFKGWIKEFKKNHEGARNAYSTLFLAAGADATVVGADMKQLDFKITQGAGETRIAAAAGVPPVIVGLSEGLAAATYANYSQARRRFADQTMRPLWRNAAGSLSRIIRVPSDSELWYDDRDIKALQEDQIDAANIQSTQANTIRTLLDAGFTPESVVKAVENEDYGLLQHSGLYSVQLQAPGSDDPDPEPPAEPPSSDEPAPETPPQRDMAIDLLDRELQQMLREARDERPINVNVTTPDVSVNVEPAEIRFEQPAPPVNVNVEAAPTPDINVNFEPPNVTVEAARAPDVNVNVEAAPAPDVNVNVEAPQVTVQKSGKRVVDFGDGRSATVTEGDVKKIEYDDGREVTITEVDE